jgi:hypothetical protein
MSTTNEGGKKSMMIDFGTGADPFNAVQFHEKPLTDEHPQEQEQQEQEDPDVDDDTSSQTTIDIEDADQEDSTDESDSDDKSSQTDESDTEDNIDSETDTADDGDDDEDSDVNLYYHIGNELKNDSFLPDDFEITDDIDGATLKQSVKTKLREELEPAIRQEFQQTLVNEGYNEQDLLVARAIRQGVDPNLLSTASMYETYANISDDISDSEKETVISQMYRSRGLQGDEIANLIKIAKGDEEEKVGEEFDKLFLDSKTFFEGKYGEFIKAEEERNSQLQEQAVINLQKTNELINGVISNRKLGDVTMSPQQAKDFEDAIRKPGVVDISGQKYQSTELQKFLYDFQTNDELKLLTFFLHKFRDQQKDQLKKEAKKEVESEFMNSYKQRVVKSKASKNQRKVKETIDAQKKKGNSIFLDFSK